MRASHRRVPLIVGYMLCVQPLAPASAQSPAPGAIWVYQLLDGSRIVDDCPICDRVPIIQPLRGSFDLRCLQPGPLFSFYAVENICFTNIGTGGPTYKVTGHGSYQIGGEIALRQSLTLELWIDNGVTNKQCFFTNVSSGVIRLWPMLQISIAQTNGTVAQQDSFDLNAAPLREIWFSTAEDFVAGIWNSPSNLVKGGDFLSTQGRRVKSNEQLTEGLGIMPPVPDLGLKDVDILPGGEIAFSLEQDAFSESLGRTLHSGDLLSNRGYVLRTNSDLVAAFAPDNLPVQGAGLAAVQMISPSEIWFSVQTNFNSQALNTAITPGDLLSERGFIIRTNAQLLSRFKPVGLTNYVALKSIYVWPSSEIWFCTGSGFDDATATHYGAGDLLSDQGYVVFRNSDLLSAFAPVPAGTNVTVDALYVVTDAIPNSSPPLMATPQITNQPPSSIALLWRGQGRVFQVESATNPAGPFWPAAPITPDSLAVDAGALTNSPSRFYRLHQW